MFKKIELPSMEEIAEMEKQRERATESLEISDGHVKCQGCGSLWPIIKDDSRLIDSHGSKRVHQLQVRLKDMILPALVSRRKRQNLQNC